MALPSKVKIVDFGPATDRKTSSKAYPLTLLQPLPRSKRHCSIQYPTFLADERGRVRRLNLRPWGSPSYLRYVRQRRDRTNAVVLMNRVAIENGCGPRQLTGCFKWIGNVLERHSDSKIARDGNGD